MIGERLGRLFEVGFNLGLLHYLNRTGMAPDQLRYYRQALEKLKFPRIVRSIIEAENIIDERDIRIVEDWVYAFLAHGFLAGQNFLPEYFNTLGWDRNLKKVSLAYFQANFSGDNSFGFNLQQEKDHSAQLLSRFNLPADPHQITGLTECYSQKGEFLKADTLFLFRRSDQYWIVCLDLSVYSYAGSVEMYDLANVEVLRSRLQAGISHLRSRSVFAGISLDTGELPLDFASDLSRYLTAFKREDKESAKLIQAASYAESFYRFLREEKIIQPFTGTVKFNVLGYTDRGISAMTLGEENLALLKSCAHIYKNHDKVEDINRARQEVLKVIQQNAARSFENGGELVKKLLNTLPDQLNIVTHQERLVGFHNTQSELSPEFLEQLGLVTTAKNLNLRNAHAALLKQALANPALTFLFATGNPGIGKTTAVVEFLKERASEGFLFIYASPRKQVNLDIISKFKGQGDDPLCDDRIMGLNTNSEIIRNSGGRFAVKYLTNRRQGDFTQQGVKFIDGRPNEEKVQRWETGSNLKRRREDELEDRGEQTAGVLNSLFEAISSIVNTGSSTNIVATATVQALKKTGEQGDTLRHMEKIFNSAYNSRDNRVLPEQMKKLSGRIRHLFIMIDEITGDDSGAEFLRRVSSILAKYELLDGRHGFNTKIIVADASIVDPEVIRTHLQEQTAEPDKIFFRKASTELAQPVVAIPYQHEDATAIVINANSYPASALNISYKLFVDSFRYRADLPSARSNELVKRIQAEIEADLLGLLGDPASGQVLVYIQDKRRLAELIGKLTAEFNQNFVERRDYLQIHANISELEKQQVSENAIKVRVVFMTASASRGLSFPKARHILVDLPGFSIESNLMEIIQVIYRGRGDYLDEETSQWGNLDLAEKNLTFYLGDRAMYYSDTPEEKALSLRESTLNLLNILIILKTSVMTRIYGSGQIGGEDYLMIPIGGKGVTAAGESFSSRMHQLVRELEKEDIRKFGKDKALEEIRQALLDLLGNYEVELGNNVSGTFESYLDLQKKFRLTFIQQASVSFASLLEFATPEMGYIFGDLLVVPLSNRSMHENYMLRLEQGLKRWLGDDRIKRMITAISKNLEYPESLRSGLREFSRLVRELENIHTTQHLVQNSQRDDLYYALPLSALFFPEPLAAYFKAEPVEPEDQYFRKLLENYVRSLFPAEDVLPIGSQYREFPFVVFRCFNLKELRGKLFTGKYLLNSYEMSLLNLILST